MWALTFYIFLDKLCEKDYNYTRRERERSPLNFNSGDQLIPGRLFCFVKVKQSDHSTVLRFVKGTRQSFIQVQSIVLYLSEFIQVIRVYPKSAPTPHRMPPERLTARSPGQGPLFWRYALTSASGTLHP